LPFLRRIFFFLARLLLSFFWFCAALLNRQQTKNKKRLQADALKQFRVKEKEEGSNAKNIAE
jgi:hypothetical protein